MYKPKYDSPKTYYLHVKCYQCLRKKLSGANFLSCHFEMCDACAFYDLRNQMLNDKY